MHLEHVIYFHVSGVPALVILLLQLLDFFNLYDILVSSL